jgi:hypothetical protein
MAIFIPKYTVGNKFLTNPLPDGHIFMAKVVEGIEKFDHDGESNREY